MQSRETGNTGHKEKTNIEKQQSIVRNINPDTNATLDKNQSIIEIQQRKGMNRKYRDTGNTGHRTQTNIETQ